MKWNELLKIAKEKGFVLVRHGKKHDLYKNETTGDTIWMERHSSQEVKPSLLKDLKKKIGI